MSGENVMKGEGIFANKLPLGTVKAQLFRARELLAEVLKHIEGKM